MKARWLALLAVLALAAIALWFYFRPQPRLEVEVVPVRRGPVISSVTASTTGTIASDSQAVLASRVAGQVVTLLHKGDAVRRGEPVAVLDEAPFLAAVEQAEGAVDAARADLERLESGRRMREEATDSERDRALAVFDQARQEFERMHDLHRQGIVSASAFEAAEAEFRVAEAAHRSAIARLDDRGVIEREIAAARARVRQMEGALETARLQLDWSRLPAPFDGLVGETFVREGELVSPGQVVASLSDSSTLYVETSVDEVDLPRIAIGQPAVLMLDSFPDEEFAGAVRRIAPVVSDRKREGRTADVEVGIDDPSGRVLPGMSVDCEIITARSGNALWIPTSALVTEGGRRLAWKVAGGLLRKAPVEAGGANWERTEIVSGLSEGDLVVTSVGRAELSDGMRVKTVPAPEERARRPRGE